MYRVFTGDVHLCLTVGGIRCMVRREAIEKKPWRNNYA